MDFRSVNTYNARLNMMSGNLLPITVGSFSIYWQIYSTLVWLLEIALLIVLIPGCLLVSKEKALRDGLIGVAIIFEVNFMVMRLHMRRKLLKQLIQKFNDILCSEDELMRNIVKTTSKSVNVPLKVCLSVGLVSIILWCSLPYSELFKKDSFLYEDYKMPVAFGKEPVSTNIFIVGSLLVTVSNLYLFAKKVSVDTYMIHLILLTTAQYRYIAQKLSVIIQNGMPSTANIRNIDEKKNYFNIGENTQKQIRMLCQHHNAVLCITFMLRDLMSMNFTLIYVNNVFRFCSIAIMMLNLSTMGVIEGMMTIAYSCGGVMQLYLLCYCVQQLLDAGTEITDKAFHENWYQHGAFIKRIFIMMIMANSLEYRLSRFEKFNLSLPSFMSIMNQAYSIAILVSKTS